MSSRRSLKIARPVGALLWAVFLLIGAAPVLRAQSPPPAAQEVPERATTPRPSPTPAAKEAAGEERAAENRGSAYRQQPDNLKPFAPSEEIRVDKAVDFPADI